MNDEYVFDLSNYRAHEGETIRDILLALLDEHRCCVADGDAEKLVDAFAHQLAEQIHQASSDDWDHGDQNFGAGEAADLIDPKVTT